MKRLLEGPSKLLIGAGAENSTKTSRLHESCLRTSANTIAERQRGYRSAAHHNNNRQEMKFTNSSPDHFYGSFLKLVMAAVENGSNEADTQRLLNGAAADAVHEWVPRNIRTLDGIFFSGHALAKEAASFLAEKIQTGARVFDPACGGGDLLLAAAKLLPIGETLSRTLEQWSVRLGGTDIHESFVETTKWRLILLAKSRHGIESAPTDFPKPPVFPNIRVADYLSDATVSDDFDCILVNPPFGHRAAPPECKWSSGKTQFAAIFLDKIIKHRKPRQCVVAILPDVLRGGSRYERWRDEISMRAICREMKIYGRFEKRTDVDVFITKYDVEEICVRLAAADESGSVESKADTKTVGDTFVVKVGTVVPHRHPGKQGSRKPYLTVSNALINMEVAVDIYRCFEGVCFMPPFVAIRRTSNPSDARRIGCTIVTGTREVAVENHLIIAAPLSGGIEECRRLVDKLNSEKATEHINSQLRCRHLTTSSIKSIPI